MTKKAADPTTKPTDSKPLTQALKPASVSILFLDTSTRLFVPSVGGTVLGVWADNSWGAKPWMTLIGVSLGTVIAFSLVYLQIKSIKNDDQKDTQK
jgi:F0F1-type ATP synthase assembly protein I